MIKQLIDKEVKEYTIKVSTLREHFKDGDTQEWGKSLWLAKITDNICNTYFNATTEKKLFKRIKEELGI